MAWLSQNSQVRSLDDLLNCEGDKQLQVAITFDDGYSSVAELAAPIMARHGITGTVYLTASCMAEDSDSRQPSNPALGHFPGERFMLWSEARDLYKAGWQVASHGMTHEDMTQQGEVALRSQMQGARKLIEDRIGNCCNAFAYPWGRHNAKVRCAAREAGYAHAAGTIHAPLREEYDHFAFPRIDVRRNYSLKDIEQITRGDWDYLGHIQTARSIFHS
jgi:peptidoglycan/xylan/chitin deacetylase (PgdA/CDA1 family)